jgi:hypothetical protein
MCRSDGGFTVRPSGPAGYLAYSCGYPIAVIQRAREMIRLRGGASVRIIAVSDVTGYGAIVVAERDVAR